MPPRRQTPRPRTPRTRSTAAAREAASPSTPRRRHPPRSRPSIFPRRVLPRRIAVSFRLLGRGIVPVDGVVASRRLARRRRLPRRRDRVARRRAPPPPPPPRPPPSRWTRARTPDATARPRRRRSRRDCRELFALALEFRRRRLRRRRRGFAFHRAKVLRAKQRARIPVSKRLHARLLRPRGASRLERARVCPGLRRETKFGPGRSGGPLGPTRGVAGGVEGGARGNRAGMAGNAAGRRRSRASPRARRRVARFLRARLAFNRLLLRRRPTLGFRARRRLRRRRPPTSSGSRSGSTSAARRWMSSSPTADAGSAGAATETFSDFSSPPLVPVRRARRSRTFARTSPQPPGVRRTSPSPPRSRRRVLARWYPYRVARDRRPRAFVSRRRRRRAARAASAAPRRRRVPRGTIDVVGERGERIAARFERRGRGPRAGLERACEFRAFVRGAFGERCEFALDVVDATRHVCGDGVRVGEDVVEVCATPSDVRAPRGRRIGARASYEGRWRGARRGWRRRCRKARGDGIEPGPGPGPGPGPRRSASAGWEDSRASGRRGSGMVNAPGRASSPRRSARSRQKRASSSCCAARAASASVDILVTGGRARRDGGSEREDAAAGRDEGGRGGARAPSTTNRRPVEVAGCAARRDARARRDPSQRTSRIQFKRSAGDGSENRRVPRAKSVVWILFTHATSAGGPLQRATVARCTPFPPP